LPIQIFCIKVLVSLHRSKLLGFEAIQSLYRYFFQVKEYLNRFSRHFFSESRPPLIRAECGSRANHNLSATVARSWRSFSANPSTTFRNLAKNSAIFWLFVVLVLGTKTGSFALFSLNKFVFNTPNKNFSQAVSLCSTVDAIGPTVHLSLIYF
jgi:hypothetical protein